MISVSLCMIVKNEEDVLERCLKSVAGLVDEIIIVDTGSTDRTREIATHFTNQIFDFPWQDDFSAARNEAFSHASMDYCMWLDADDVFWEEDQKAFLNLKETLDPCRSKLWIACSDLFYMSERAHAAAPPFQTEPAYAGLRFGAALCAAFFLSVLTVCSKFESHVLAN